jgi:hypothetical protein
MKTAAAPQNKEYDVYMKQMLSTKVFVRMVDIGKNTKSNLEKLIVQKTEGKCIPEGYVRPRSVNVLKYSAGMINAGHAKFVEFYVLYECFICNPVEGMTIDCKVTDLTMAGVHAVVDSDIPGKPLIEVFIARDHNFMNRKFAEVKENDRLKVRIIGKRFELNDPCITVCALLTEGSQRQGGPAANRGKPKVMIIEDDEVDLDLEDEYEQDESNAQIPKLLDSVDPADLLNQIRTLKVDEEKIDGYDVVFVSDDETHGDFTRAFQEDALLKARLTTRDYRGNMVELPSFWEVWNKPGSTLPKDLRDFVDGPHEAKWKLQKKHGYKLATTFRPIYARSIYDYYLADAGKGSVLDPCAGWGDRMTGALASKNVTKYVGFDPNTSLLAGYKSMMGVAGYKDTGTDPLHLQFSNGFEIYSAPFETGSKALESDTFDFAFTSPPFFEFEIYSDGNPKYRDWIQEFYIPLFVETARLLKPGAKFAIYLEDTSAGKISEFLETKVEEISSFRLDTKIGFKGIYSEKLRTIMVYQKEE